MTVSVTEYKVMVDHNGIWWAIFEGEGIPREELEAAARDVSGDGALITEVWHLHFQRRVKWCGHHGEACDSEGEWHSHWNGVRPGPGTAHTLARMGVEQPVRSCRACGCTDERACINRCYWVNDPQGGDLCSACQGGAR